MRDVLAALTKYGIAHARERFKARLVVKHTGCWEVTGAANKGGYVSLTFGKGVRIRAHRASWALEHGADPGELMVCHKCDNPRCANPEHLFLGTARDNVRDMIAKGRRPNMAALIKWKPGLKITPDQAREIIEDGRPAKVVGPEYGIHPQTVRAIRRGAVWKTLGGTPSEKTARRRANRSSDDQSGDLPHLPSFTHEGVFRP